MSEFQILGISGSLRKASLNGAALRAAQQLTPGQYCDYVCRFVCDPRL
jgi:NAD(P)H-dependent FMN reductase